MSSSLPKLPIVVCIPAAPARNVPRTVSYPSYIHEILSHAGLCYRSVSEEDLVAELPDIRLLITVGEADWPEATQSALEAWAQAGGSWLSIGGVCGLPGLFGVEKRQPRYQGAAWGGQSATLGEGYLEPFSHDHPVIQNIPVPLHFFNGIAFQLADGQGTASLARHLDAHQREGQCPLVVERSFGVGRCLLLAPDVIGAIVRIQQGVAVTRDGVPAADGTGSVTDGVLKCDDGAVLDWIFDRQEVPGSPGLSCFLEPIADHWRSLLLRSILYLAREADVPVHLLWFYPRNLPALGHLSYDSDHNVPALAHSLLRVTEEAQTRATWCIILPGYDAPIRGAIEAGGNELAMHYDAMDNVWSEAEFDRQWQALSEQFGYSPYSNKNHFTRWQGDTDFFDWCARRNIQIDGSKGPSKFGEAGFIFGSCHPYFPATPEGGLVDVLELPFLSQDLEVFIPRTVIEPFVEATVSVHGVMHLLFHPNHIERSGVADALREAVRRGREAGMEWWTSREINDWERARRRVKWSVDENGVVLESQHALEGATILTLKVAETVTPVNGIPANSTIRWGFEFQAVTLDLEPHTAYRVK